MTVEPTRAPAPGVDVRAPRFAAWVTSAVLAVALLTGAGWLVAAQAVVFAVATHITVMHQGRVLAEGTPAEVRARREVQQVYLGEAA